MAPPMISCLTVTQEGRLGSLALAVADFARQTERDRELVIVHDGGDGFHEGVAALARAHAGTSIRALRAPAVPKLTLGTLRNLAVEASRGDYVCQWDDDDRC